MRSEHPQSSLPHFCLGGHDLEMIAIADLLLIHLPSEYFHDRNLTWGAAASAYREVLDRYRPVVLVELKDDLPPEYSRDGLTGIDHHNETANRPCALRQVFDLLELPAEEWTREFDLIAANDTGHARGMLRLTPPATLEEMREIRRRDRAAQGITDEEERQGEEAAKAAEVRLGGRLTVVTIPHDRTATVADVLSEELGGPGYETLLILSPSETTVFAPGAVIERLSQRFLGGWWGGDLPRRGFFGHPTRLDVGAVEALL